MWKRNWRETRERFEAWWDRRGLLLGAWGSGLPMPAGALAHENVAPPSPPRDAEARHRDPSWVARHWEARMARSEYPADVLPVAWPDLGTVTTAVLLGARESYGENNIWYEPCMPELDSAPPLALDREGPAWQRIEAVVRETARAAQRRFLVGMPAITSGLDVLAALRGEEGLLMDMALNAQGVRRRLGEIQPLYRETFDSFREIISDPDGTMCFGYFMLWGHGRVGLCQCDLAALFSRAMFEELMVPDLREQTAFLDRSMFHIDGKQALVHLEPILGVEDLDAVEFTPDPSSPPAGDPSWYPLYRRILEAGKSVWIAPVAPGEALPLLRVVGTDGVYLTVAARGAEELLRVEAEARDLEGRRGV